jgi:hypothetical protein
VGLQTTGQKSYQLQRIDFSRGPAALPECATQGRQGFDWLPQKTDSRALWARPLALSIFKNKTLMSNFSYYMD